MRQDRDSKKGFSGNRPRSNFGGNRSSGGNRGGFGGNRSSGGNRGGFGGNRGFEPREMHKAICSDCKQECEVPFKPTEGKPVYCKECFSKHKKY